MPQLLNVYSLPSLTSPEEITGGVAVVIDVLRASTTIIHALEAGAAQIQPCLQVEDARAEASRLPEGQFLLGGERKGLRIEGFDLGNSPDEYTPEVVSGKTIVFTTTNGTQAMGQCRLATKAYIAAFVNVSAICQKLTGEEQIHIVCAGTKGQIGNDDILLAGMIVERLEKQGGMMYTLNAQAITARETWLATFALPYALGAEPLEPELLAKQLRKTPGGRNLVAVGLEKDILTASQIDRFSLVPQMDPSTMRIRYE